MDLRKHLERSHQITEEQYEENFRISGGSTKRVVKQSVTKDDNIHGGNKSLQITRKDDLHSQFHLRKTEQVQQSHQAPKLQG